ncbi:MAG: type I methionyl aminopeptidase [Anaerolineales bacterium]|nr:type I methionyl aminopeptidase [Anaerolineales bacterium]
MSWERDIILKTKEDIEGIRLSGRINAQALKEVRDAIVPGVTTAKLDKIAETVIRDHGGVPAFLNYPGPYPYPGTINACLNEELVHGIPSKRELSEGDLISIDCGTILNGYYSDSAFSKAVGTVAPLVEELLKVTEEALYIGIENMRPGNRIGDVAAAVQSHVEAHGFHVPREYTGHGVGKKLHEGPSLPNFGLPGRGLMLREGMTIAIEPMVMAGTFQTKVMPDKWTVTSADNSLTAHFEHTVVVTKAGPVILTKIEG